MKRRSKINKTIIDFITHEIINHPRDIASIVSRKFNIHRVTSNRYIRNLVSEGKIEAHGATSARYYTIPNTVSAIFQIEVDSKLEEHIVWKEKIFPYLKNLNQNVVEICQYGSQEMINNVKDHSQSKKMDIMLTTNISRIDLMIRDYGIGIFEKIRRECHLEDPRHALLELSKGKLTTDPARHSGEGIFFTSRMFQNFSISSDSLYYSRTMEDNDEWLVEVAEQQKIKGTLVSLSLSPYVSYSDADVFKRYENEDHSFAKTHVPVRLAKYEGEQLVSRSQARRVLARFNKFSEVLLDFKDVPKIGQAFADEIFRVFKNEHPEVVIIPVRADAEVRRMIQHVNPDIDLSQLNLFDE